MEKPKVPLELNRLIQNTSTNSALMAVVKTVKGHLALQVRISVANVIAYHCHLLQGLPYFWTDFIKGQSPLRVAHIQWLMEVDL